MAGLKEEMQIALHYLLEEHRRKTFKKWVFSSKEPCNADKMAEAGFIFTGNRQEPDAAKCFFCNKALDGWDSTDDPWKEHLKHAPKCKFAKLQKPQDLITLDNFLDLKHDLLRSIIHSYMDKTEEEIKETVDRLESFGHKIVNKK